MICKRLPKFKRMKLIDLREIVKGNKSYVDFSIIGSFFPTLAAIAMAQIAMGITVGSLRDSKLLK